MAIQRHLSALHWEIRDTTVEFVTSLVDQYKGKFVASLVGQYNKDKLG